MMVSFKRAVFHNITFFIILASQATWAQNVSLQKPIEGWDEIFRDKQVEAEYVVQSGDNLYDVSTIFFGDAHYWPKIWSLNPSITNPHLISPGQVIFFRSGTLSTPPAVGISSEIGNAPIKNTVVKSFDKPVIPEPRSKKLVKVLPNSLPQIYANAGVEASEKNLIAEIQSGKRPVDSQFNTVDLTSEILASEPKSLGRLISVEDGGSFARFGDRVMLKFDSPVSEGDVFSFYNVDEEKILSKGLTTGHIVRWLGEVKILSQVADAKSDYIGEITKAFSAIPTQASLSNEKIKTFEYGRESSSSAINSDKKLEVLGAQGMLGRSLIGEGEIIYLSKGSDAGVSLGQVYSLETSISDFFGEGEAKGVPGQVALFKVLSVNKNHSTGIVYNLTHVISSGAETRTNSGL